MPIVLQSSFIPRPAGAQQPTPPVVGGGGGGGGSPPDWDAMYTTELAAARSGGATTRYVDPSNSLGTASDANTGTSRSLPKLTMVNAINAMAAGDELIVIGNGVTISNSASNVITKGTGASGAAAPNGSSYTAMTIIRAETPYGVTFKHETTGDIFNVGVCNMSGSYLWVDGINFHVENFAEEACLYLTGTNNRLTRCLYRSYGVAGGYSEYKQPINAAGSNNLVQDVALVGVMRYGVYTGNGGSGSNSLQNVFRRVVARCDGYDASGTSGQPQAVFACYGDNSSGTAVGQMHYHNCIAIDSIRASTASGNADSYTWGAWYNPKITFGNVYRGCIALNCETSRGGFMIQDNLGGTNPTMTDCVAWDIKFATIGNGSAQGALSSNSGTSGTWNRLTLGNYSGGLSGFDAASGAMTNTMFSDYSGLQAQSGAPSSTAYCTFQDGDASGTNQVTFNQSFEWITRTPFTTQGSASDRVGANIEKAWGAHCTNYGQTGYDTEQAYQLWPFPYESEIKTFFSAATGSGTSTRGFCTGTSVDGSSQSLTRYIWEYEIKGVQAQIPSGIYP